ncbi:adenylate kinase [Microlunatus elymi]|uniref:Adenylate kinase n=2 Tax=Microlunatus elymi TaxID=2596828 RepID=A0A516Q729_9ACTN|nr:adenylate kinase [Microlunatus elymi]
MVYGVTGSGKSTLAQELAERTGLPPVAVDELTWRPGWVPVPGDEQRKIISEICAGESWILDHGYGKWLDIVNERVELIIGLDYPRWLSLSRLVRRTIGNVLLRTPTCNGNTETVATAVADDSIVRWHFRSFARKRQRLREWAADPQGPPVLVFSHPRQVERWLAAQRPGPVRG